MIRKTIALCALLFAGVASAQTKISDLTALAAAPATGDLVAIVDVSDTTQAATGSTKKITASNLFLFRFPASSTDNAISRYDGTSGTLQDSGITVADVTGSSVTVATTAGNSLVVETTEPAATTGASVAGTTTALRAGDAVASTDTAGAAAGGDVTITAGAAARLTSGNANGGSINLVTGAGIGTGVAGSVLVPQGAVTALGVAFTGDTDTGIYASAANTIAFATNGIQRATISAGGLNIPTGHSIIGAGTAYIYGFQSIVDERITTHTTTAAQSRYIYTNAGDADGSSIALLNDPGEGNCYGFAVAAAQTLTITPSAGETLYMGTDQCVASMTANAIGATVTICAIVGGSGGVWASFGASGWTCND